MNYDIIVVGGGAAGLLAAGLTARSGLSTVLLESGSRLGHKLLLTGKGRCNLTNDCSIEDVMKNIPRNSRFLFSALSRFSPTDTMAFFESIGLKLKTERGGRVFPASDKSGDVLDALIKFCKKSGVNIIKEAKVTEIIISQERACGVRTIKGEYYADNILLATGGMSYPLTGSTGDGYKLAAALGHTIIDPQPSLVPLEADDCSDMQGLSLRNVSLRLVNQAGKTVFTDFGELLFTHYGTSGPLTLSASAHMIAGERYRIVLDLKPALDEKTLDARLLRDFEKFRNRDFSNALSDLYNSLMIPVIIDRSGIPPDTKVNSITKEQRRRLLELTKNFEIKINGKRPIDEAVITSGGVKTGEINPATMESKLVPGLYFAGEVIDVDAYTGGFNLQIAWSTAKAFADGCGK